MTDSDEVEGEREGPLRVDDSHHSEESEFAEALGERLAELDAEDATVVMGGDGEPEAL